MSADLSKLMLFGMLLLEKNGPLVEGRFIAGIEPLGTRGESSELLVLESEPLLPEDARLTVLRHTPPLSSSIDT